MKRMSLIAAGIGVAVLTPLYFAFPDKAGVLSIVFVAFIALCLFMYLLFRNYNG